jgi:phosphoribosyl 1,2-cyclic phosphate phosphodiesterase
MATATTTDRSRTSPQAVFLGSSGCVRVPAFFCRCENCRAARRRPELRRTRAGLAVLGREIVLIDAGPDLEEQLAREAVERIDRILITHWHFDHVGGLGALGEIASICGWPPIHVYVPAGVASHFDQELAYMGSRLEVHRIAPGDRLDLPDAAWEVVKTEHTDHSVGFVARYPRSFAYLVDGVVPPADTCETIRDVDLLITEATMDTLDAPGWKNFSADQAAEFWRRTGIGECLLTHLSCHGWRNGRLVAGFSDAQRHAWERRRPGLRFARDGLRVPLSRGG